MFDQYIKQNIIIYLNKEDKEKSYISCYQAGRRVYFSYNNRVVDASDINPIVKQFETIIYGQTDFSDDNDLQMVDDLFTELDDLGITVRIWTNGHRGPNLKIKERLSRIEAEINLEMDFDDSLMEVINSRIKKVSDYLESKGWLADIKDFVKNEYILLIFYKKEFIYE
jgi:hypothetical protein